MNRIRGWVNVGALVGMISSLMVFQYGQARIWFAMSRDGLLPKAFSKVHTRFRHAARKHVDRGAVCRHSGGDLGHRNVRRSVEYWNAVRVYRGVRGSARAAPDAAGTETIVSGSVVPVAADSFDRVLSRADARAAAGGPGCGSSSG